jgi:uncharacterized secreted protein with C-terminal beta-propeller domain
MQVSVFDISDPGSPRQVDRLSLGNGWSPALEDSRAFTYDPQRRVAAMGFTKADPQAVNSEQSSALAVRVLHDGMLTKAGELALKTERPSRVLLDGSTVFAITDMGVVAADAASWTRTGDLFFGQTSGATGLG